MLKAFCIGCNKPADEIEEYTEAAEEWEMPVDLYVQQEEGTYNKENGHFLCTDCYIKWGMPSNNVGEGNWVAP